MASDTNTALLDPPVSPVTPVSTDETATSQDEGLRIVPAEWRHAPAVIEIIRSSASWYEDFVDPEDLAEHYVDEEWARRNFERREFHVGLLEDEVAGTISLQAVGEDFIYLGYVYLHTDHVGNGFGHELLEFAREETRRRGRKGMVLIAHPEAEWARRAYLKYGFEIIAEEREDVLAWEGGWLEPYYEEGFQLYRYTV